jgi:hypothetical protein
VLVCSQVVLPSLREHLLRSNSGCDVYAHTYNISHFSNPRNEELDCVIRAGDVYLLTSNVVIDDDASYEKARPDYRDWRRYHPPTKTLNPKPSTRNLSPKPETRNPKPETRNQVSSAH